MFRMWINLNKIDTAKHAVLFYGRLDQNTHFKLSNYIHLHIWNDYNIITLPGVFGYKSIDSGSKLLISTFTQQITGKILDIGSGSGILSLALSKISKNTSITMTEVNLFAIISSKITLTYNAKPYQMLLSNLYSSVSHKFDMIMCNPPIHNNLQLSLQVTKSIIQYSINYLKYGGELRFVTNSCISYHKILKNTFHKYKILIQNNHFKVYQAKLF